jgi:hypothetical protein
MAITDRRQRDSDTPGAIRSAVEIAESGVRGGWFATTFSAVAVVLSCISVYLSALQGPDLEVYVPPTIQYGRDVDNDVFSIPITIANSGARSAAILSIELEVRNLKTNSTKRYYSAYFGEHPREATVLNRQFAPLSIPGKAVFTETVRFYPAGKSLPRVVDAEGEYAFTVQLNTAAPARPSLLDRLQGRTQPPPISFQMTLPWISEQHLLFRKATIAMHTKDWRPTTDMSR